MLVSIATASERSRDLALLDALGMPPRQIARLLGLEQGLTAVAPSAIGLLFGAALSELIVPAVTLTPESVPADPGGRGASALAAGDRDRAGDGRAAHAGDRARAAAPAKRGGADPDGGGHMSRGGSRGSSPSGQHRRLRRLAVGEAGAAPALVLAGIAVVVAFISVFGTRALVSADNSATVEALRQVPPVDAGVLVTADLSAGPRPARCPRADRPSRRPAGRQRAEAAGLPAPARHWGSAIMPRGIALNAAPSGVIDQATPQVEIAYRSALATNSVLVQGSLPDGNAAIAGRARPAAGGDVPDRGDGGDRAPVQLPDRIGAAALFTRTERRSVCRPEGQPPSSGPPG